MINWLRELDFKVRTMELKNNGAVINHDFETLRSENEIMRKQLTKVCDRVAVLEEDNKNLRNSLGEIKKEFAEFQQIHEVRIQNAQDHLSPYHLNLIWY